MPKYRQYILRLDPSKEQDRSLIERLDEARNTWGGVQRFLRNAVLEHASGVQVDGEADDDALHGRAPEGLVAALRRTMPTASEHAVTAMAASTPLGSIRALYRALENLDPLTLTETEAALLRAFCEDIEALLKTAAEERLPIRTIIQGDAQ